ncbi:MAG: nucleotide exchange factor GrpE [Candidatus Tectomicrobia bacterium]|nr:nucleotide exchange factor GrpE [Candidatus Tectomicrobia bacterium]
MAGSDEGAPVKVQVIDRRRSARKEGEGEGGVAGEAAPSLLPTYIEQLEARAKEQEARLKAFMERQRAESEAFRERVRREAERRVEGALAGQVQELVGVLDDLERALASGGSAGGADVSPIFEGVRLVHGRLYSLLQALGLERVQSQGAAFDPNVHEAVGVARAAGPEAENQVVEELLPGYLLKGRLLRAAQVRVAKWVEGPASGAGAAETGVNQEVS